MDVVDERSIKVSDIVVSPRPVWKCRVCENYGRNPSCPPFVPSWMETRDLMRHFREAVLIKFRIVFFEEDKREVIEYLLTTETELFRQGYHYSLAFFPGSCNLCSRCTFMEEGNCPQMNRVRPSINAVGIELSSVARIDFREPVLYGLVLVG